MNLLENALKASSPSDPVEIRTEVGERELVLRISDHGPGLDPAEAERMFEPFARGQTGEGTGLGLAIARGFTEANGGQLSVESTPGRGAIFTLAFPVAEPPGAVAAATAGAGRERGGAGRRAAVSSPGPRILVVDDEAQILRALQMKLRSEGYEVDTAGTAEAALAAAAARPPDAIILDLLLPDGRGTDVCRAVREWSAAPILVLSAVGDEAEKIAALDAGADDYVTKPFSVDELLARVRAALRRTGPSREPVLELADLRIDLERRRVTMAGREIPLTPTEYDLLRLLAENEGKLLTHPAILRAVWGPAYREESNYLHVYVSQLRRKIEPDPARPRYILTVPGVGYRLVGAGA